MPHPDGALPEVKIIARLWPAGQKAGRGATAAYTRVGKFALIKHQRYAHAKQFKRANRALRTLKTYLGRVIRDIPRQSQHP